MVREANMGKDSTVNYHVVVSGKLISDVIEGVVKSMRRVEI